MKTPIRILVKPFLLSLAFANLALGVSEGQDPFSPEESVAAEKDAEGAMVKDASNDASGRPSETEKNAVVLSIRATPPRTAGELARAIQLMARIRRWDEVGHWMDQAAKLGLNEVTATQMVEIAGTQTFVQLIGLESGLSEARKSNARKILDLAAAASHNPKKLSDSVLMLRSSTKAERIRGYRALQSAGNRGVAALINHVLDSGSAVPSPAMCEAFSLMGNPALAAWQAAFTTSDPEARGKLALLAVRTGNSALTTELCVAANDTRIDPSVRDELAKIAASKNKSIPSVQIVYRHAIEQMQKSLSMFQKVRGADEPDSYLTWQLSSDGTIVTDKPARLADLDWVRTAQLANAAIQCGESADNQSGLAVAILCENAWRTSPDSANSLSIADVASALPNTIHDSYEFGCLVWDSAEKHGLASAQLSAIRNLGRFANAETIPNAVRERLSKACASGHGAVRYAAAEALLSTMVVRSEDGSTQLTDVHFDGRNRLEKVLAEMRLLEGSPLALVVGGAVDLRTHTKTLLESFGYRVVEASSASDTMGILRTSQPIESVFIVSHVLEMNLGDLTQRIRANPSTATCPIAILAASLSRGEHEIAGLDPRLVMGSVPPEQADFADILRRMEVVSQSPVIDSASRSVWQELSALYWADRQSKFVTSQAKAVATKAVDTPLGQQELVRIATDNSVSMPNREQASQNFVQSVKQFGVMLSSEAVKAQYDEYNKRGPDDSDLRIVLGRILDAIEAAKGDRPWAEVAP